MEDKYLFWTDDITILYRNGKYADFFPQEEMTRIEQLNSLTRFFMYYILLLMMFDRQEANFYFPILAIVFLVLVYYVYMGDDDGKLQDLEKSQTVEKMTNIVDKIKNVFGNGKEHMDNMLLQPTDLNYGIKNKVERLSGRYKDIDDNIVVESGYYDSNNNLVVGPKYTPPRFTRNKKPDYNYEDKITYTRGTCRQPTIDNPFMNSSATDYGAGRDIPEACNADDVDIKENITRSFNDNLFRDVDAVWENENSQRQFFTVPVKSVPDTVGFANWLYKSPNDSSCKEDNAHCLKNINIDLRYER